jgi:hypothetical protein
MEYKKRSVGVAHYTMFIPVMVCIGGNAIEKRDREKCNGHSFMVE